ncbi:MAG: IgGFc-binding protein, partial [bacterium]
MAMRRTLFLELFEFFRSTRWIVFGIENVVVKRFLFTLLFLIFSAHLQAVHAQTRDHKGQEFFFAFLPNPIDPLTLQVGLHADNETKVLVEYPVGVPLSDSITVLPGQVTIVDIPQEAGEQSGWPGHTFGQGDNNSIRVSATQAIACYLISRNDASSDGGLAIPTNALHKNYVVMSYDIGSQTDGDASLFAVIAAHDSTRITITPVRNLESAFPPGEPFSVLLKKGEAFLAESAFGFFGKDSTLAGSFIKSTKPVSVINGNKCSRVPFGNPSCDHLFEVAQPIQTWGKHVLVTALGEESIRPSGAVYRILTSAPNTTVLLDGQPLGTISENQFLDTDTLRGSHLFTADNPIFVTQFMTSKVTANSASADPGMVNMIPTGQFADSYTFSIPSNAQSVPLFENNRVTVIIKNEDIGKFTLNSTV